MSKITTVLFDFDGVVVDTEPLYDIFWGRIAEEYRLGIPDFPARIKGTTLSSIFEKYFSHLPESEWQKIQENSAIFERDMDYPLVPGAVDFVDLLKRRGYKVGLVTSSLASKMKVALARIGLEEVFDTIVTADRIRSGKPDPMCYLLAAADLGARPSECVVCEDAFPGIQAAVSAGMRVIGLSTTNPAEAIRDRVYAVIPDFSDTDKVMSLILK